MQRRREMMRLTTGCKSSTDLLRGGVETQSITELFGDFGSGQDPNMPHAMHYVPTASREGGLSGGVIYIDTEGTFRPERLCQIAESRGLNTEQVLQNVVLCKIYNSSHLELVVKSLGKFIEKYNAKLIVVDSIISLHRAEFMQRNARR